MVTLACKVEATIILIDLIKSESQYSACASQCIISTIFHLLLHKAARAGGLVVWWAEFFRSDFGECGSVRTVVAQGTDYVCTVTRNAKFDGTVQ